MTNSSGGRLVLAVALAVCASTALAAPPKTKKIQCWTDENGNRVCGDSMPPENAGSERTVIDQQGRTRTIPAAPTPEEREALEAAEREAAEAKRVADQEAANDRSLLATYSKPEDIAALRDDRLMTLDANARIAAKTIERDQAELDDMRKSVAQGDASKPKDAKVLKDIGEYETALAEKRRALAELGVKRAKICSTFERDIRRFQELKFGKAAYSSPCPPPDSLGTDVAEVDLKAARKAFDAFASAHTQRSPAVFNSYAPDAVVRYLFLAASGKKETAELTRDDYRQETTTAWQKLKPDAPGPTFSDVNVETGKNGAAKVSAKVDGQGFWVVIKPVDKKWLVLEQWSEAKF
ncbi:MAG TPA: hypothetical protein VJM11_04565 [Nevskiaceae bacterium]|nr:hypothetical protein [Nevskiaceae bacterium]